VRRCRRTRFWQASIVWNAGQAKLVEGQILEKVDQAKNTLIHTVATTWYELKYRYVQNAGHAKREWKMGNDRL